MSQEDTEDNKLQDELKDELKDFEVSEDDLLLMDKQFLEAINEKNVEHSIDDVNNQQSFFIFVILAMLLIFGIVLAFVWIIKGYNIRKRRRTRLYI